MSDFSSIIGEREEDLLMCNFVEIKDLEIEELRVYQAYRENQLRKFYEPEPGIFICESPKVIERALDAGYEAISILTAKGQSGDLDGIYEKCGDIPVYCGDDQVLRNLAGYALTGGSLAAMRRKALPSLEQLLEGKRRIAVLDNVQNPTNVGAIFRSAAAMGMEAVVLTHDSTDPLYKRAERVSVGTVFQIPWTRVGRKEDYLTELKDLGFATVAMALSDQAVSIQDPGLKAEEKLAIILGNEGYGLSEERVSRSDYVAKIPMNPLVDSLNVAAASAVMFWELTQD